MSFIIRIEPDKMGFKKYLTKKILKDWFDGFIMSLCLLPMSYFVDQPMSLSQFIIIIMFFYIPIFLYNYFLFISNSFYELNDEGIYFKGIINRKIVWGDVIGYSLETIKNEKKFKNLIIHMKARDYNEYEKYTNKIFRLYVITLKDIEKTEEIFSKIIPPIPPSSPSMYK